ncbi:MAG: CBS domain-containing protein [Oligoflexales bacterium]|nr:CBS domain-containing protein [Oligoflexales bacterium]
MLKVKDVMTTDVITIEGNATVASAIRIMKDKKIRSLIITPRSAEDAYGILTEADIAYKVLAYSKNPNDIPVHTVMTKPCIVVNPDLGVEYAARLFAQTKIHRAPVIKDKLLGIVSITDILRRTEC